MYICKCSKIVHIIIERNLTSVLNLTEATQKNGKFSWQKAKKKKCLYITNCRQYCFSLLGLISSVLMSLIKVRTSTRFDPVTSRYWCNALPNWAMKPLTLGGGHLWVLRSLWGMNVEVICEIFLTLNCRCEIM